MKAGTASSPFDETCSERRADSLSPQDAEVGDGTTSVVLLAVEILKQMKPFVE